MRDAIAMQRQSDGSLELAGWEKYNLKLTNPSNGKMLFLDESTPQECRANF
jgi:hypothetical protein